MGLKLFQKKVQKHGCVCHYCHRFVSGEDATIDHKVPKALGGGNNWENLVPACSSCNGKKGMQSYESFMKYSELQRKPLGVYKQTHAIN